MSQAQKIFQEARTILRGQEVERSREHTIEAEIILQHAMGLRLRSDLYQRWNQDLDPVTCSRALEWARQRASGAVLQYVIGTQQFLDHAYEVGPGVLVPRPETEVLVAHAIQSISQICADKPLLGFEIGLGSGAISIELLKRFPDLQMIASELSPEAATYARRNARRLLGENWERRLQVLAPESSSLILEPFEGVGVRADFLISNPPYLSPQDEIAEDVRRFEPETALFPSGGDPLLFYRAIALRAAGFLRTQAPVFLELPHERAEAVGELFKNQDWIVQVFPDLTGRARVLEARMVTYG